MSVGVGVINITMCFSLLTRLTALIALLCKFISLLLLRKLPRFSLERTTTIN